MQCLLELSGMTLATLENGVVQILANCPKPGVMLLFGDLGAGKTTLVKAICRQLGVDSLVNSPTFSIIQEYNSPTGPIYHLDLYRINSNADAHDLGLDDYFTSGFWCFVEWPEKITSWWPKDHYRLYISESENDARFVKLVRYS